MMLRFVSFVAAVGLSLSTVALAQNLPSNFTVDTLVSSGLQAGHDFTFLPDGRVVRYPIDAFARYCLTQGIDQLGYLQQQSGAIATFEEERPWKP